METGNLKEGGFISATHSPSDVGIVAADELRQVNDTNKKKVTSH